MNRIMVEVVKLPTTRRNVELLEGDTVARALVEAFGNEDFSRYSIVVNGSAASLQTMIHNGDCITVSAQIKGN